jgi:hypothetical protein
VQHHDDHHQLGPQPVQVAYQLPERDVAQQVEHVLVRHDRRRRVVDHQVDAGQDLEDAEEG